MSVVYVTRLDCSPHSVVVTCALCSCWRYLAGSRPEALRIAADHKKRVHQMRPH